MFFKNKKILIFVVSAIVLFCGITFSPVKPLFIKRTVLFAEIAKTSEQRTKGLQFRMYLGANKGMLFCFEREGFHAFWMKNTQLPLDIAFIDSDKRIINILQMTPLDEGPRYVPKNKAKYALEVNHGYFDSHDIKPGDRVIFW